MSDFHRLNPPAPPMKMGLGLLAAGLLVSSGLLAAEPVVVPLWPGPAPGDTGLAGEESVRVYESAILKGPTRLITNVTKPTVTIYSPPKDWNSGTAMLICPGGGYHNLFWELEGEEVAAWLNAHGMTGIILTRRRTPLRCGFPSRRRRSFWPTPR